MRTGSSSCSEEVCKVRSAPVHSFCRVFVAALLAVLALIYAERAQAQGVVALKTVVTDQTPLNLSNLFGTPAATAIDQHGDFAFIGNGDDALFTRTSGASSVTRLLQTGDAVPNISGSQITSFAASICESNSGILFAVWYDLPDGSLHEAVLTYSSGTYAVVARDTDTAPGTSGLTYGGSFTLVGINDSGDVAFESVVQTKPTTEPTIFFAPSGGSPIRIYGTADTLPGEGLGGITGVFSLEPIIEVEATLNPQGEILFQPLAGGVYVSNRTGQITLVYSSLNGIGAVGGGCAQMTSSFSLSSGSAAINSSGTVAFFQPGDSGAFAICSVVPGAIPATVVVSGANAPSPLSGTLQQSFSGIPLAIDDAGDVLFEASVQGTTSSVNALLRFTASTQQLSTIAYQGETDPSGTGATFVRLLQGSVAGDGTELFSAVLSNISGALYEQSGTSAPVLVAMQGASAPVIGGGKYDFGFDTRAAILNNHSAFFSDAVLGGSAYFGDFLGTPGNVHSLLSTADSLPSGGREDLGEAPQTAGNYVGFATREPGGRASYFVSNVADGTMAKIVTVGDTAPGTGGVLLANFSTPGAAQQQGFVTITGGSLSSGVITTASNSGDVFLNRNGQIALFATIEGGSATSAIFSGSASSSLKKVVASSDVIDGVYLPISVSPSGISQLNDDGQIAFLAATLATTPLVSGQLPVYAIFRANPDGSFTKIVAIGDPGPSGTTFTGLLQGPIAINNSGSVLFETNDIGSPLPYTYYAGDGTATPAQVLRQRDEFAGTAILFNQSTGVEGFSDTGTMTFSGTGIPAAPAPFSQPIAVTIGTATAPDASGPNLVAADGSSAPGGGTFSLQTMGTPLLLSGESFASGLQANAQNDILFYSQVSGGPENSGYFIQRGAGAQVGVLSALVTQGEAVPGGGTLDTMAPPSQTSAFSLSADGQLYFTQTFTNNGSSTQGFFVARQDGSLRKILAAGDMLSASGVVTGIRVPSFPTRGSGTIAFWAGTTGTSTRQTILAAQIPEKLTSTALTYSPSAPNPGQSVTLTATIASPAGGTPTGSVSFFSNGASLGAAVALSGAQAVLTTPSLAAGNYSITAQYSGDVNFAPNTSSVVTIAVTAPVPDFSVSASPSSLTITAGQSGTVTLTITPINGSTQTVTFTCSNLPAGTTCNANPPSVTLDGQHSATSTVTIQTSAYGTAAMPTVPTTPPNPIFDTRRFITLLTLFAAAIFGAVLLGAQVTPRRRKGLSFAMCLLIAAAVYAAGCGGGYTSQQSSGGTPTGNYSISVGITSGADSHSTPISVTVTK